MQVNLSRLPRKILLSKAGYSNRESVVTFRIRTEAPLPDGPYTDFHYTARDIIAKATPVGSYTVWMCSAIRYLSMEEESLSPTATIMTFLINTRGEGIPGPPYKFHYSAQGLIHKIEPDTSPATWMSRAVRFGLHTSKEASDD